jgi:hypothetical protein
MISLLVRSKPVIRADVFYWFAGSIDVGGESIFDYFGKKWNSKKLIK